MRSRHEGICSAAEQCDAIAFLKSVRIHKQLISV
jgi:hypothetical protein